LRGDVIDEMDGIDVTQEDNSLIGREITFLSIKIIFYSAFLGP
jgi:hypothetical protein